MSSSVPIIQDEERLEAIWLQVLERLRGALNSATYILTFDKLPDLDAHLQPLELALQDLPQVTATPEGAARIRNGNPGMVIASGIDWGTEVWASHQGRAIAIGRYQSGELHPSRVFN